MNESSNKKLMNTLLSKQIITFRDICYGITNEATRSECLSIFAVYCSNILSNCAILPRHFKANATTDRNFFELYLFQFLIKVYHQLVLDKKWDDALDLETSIYSEYIKQDETDVFYQRAFDALYSVYSHNNTQRVDTNIIDSIGSPTLYLLMNFNRLAHVEVLLEYFANLEDTSNIYLSALSNIGLDSLEITLNSYSIKYFTLSQGEKISRRYLELIELCKKLNIKNIVFVSLPLHSNYIKTIAPNDLRLTWWSMKFPLSGMRQFSRLVCCRSLVPDVRDINGSLWSCAPFAVKGLSSQAINTVLRPVSDAFIKFGVLAREEKFASSLLPEVISKALLISRNSAFYWTGRNFDESIHERLTSADSNLIQNRSHFVGWVNPIEYLNKIDIFIDTPNLGGIVAYWAMSLNKIVISCTESGSIGALGSKDIIATYFLTLSTSTEVKEYFSTPQELPFYLSNINLVYDCMLELASANVNIENYGILFGNFFNKYLTRFNYSATCTESMIRGDNFHV